ncbi:TVP38/TMEM64 family protein [Demequina flava]|uniref:TVP38/TMEM64 family protein n=1 Tax=Demequina flava TaxID=1095025 RepID=UPI0009E221A0|nr:TVP38/TMEM64 family protein [Demequina flava]
MHNLTPRVKWRAALFALVIVGTIIVTLTVPLPSVDEVRAAAERSGAWAAIAFAVGYALVSLTPAPKNVVSIAAGAVWGLPIGFLIVYTGALGGALLSFVISRVLGRDIIEHFTGRRLAQVDHFLKDRGLLGVLGARLVPVVPFTVLNYGAGLTTVRLWNYVLGSMIGMIPGTAAYVAVGAYGFSLEWSFFVAMGALGLLTIGGAFYAVRARTRAGNSAAASIEGTPASAQATSHHAVPAPEASAEASSSEPMAPQ